MPIAERRLYCPSRSCEYDRRLKTQVPDFGFMRMAKAEIAQLKEEITADYKRKLEALELVEQLLNQQQKSPSATGSRNKVQPAKVRPSPKVSGITIAARIEQAFQKQPKGTHRPSPVL